MVDAANRDEMAVFLGAEAHVVQVMQVDIRVATHHTGWVLAGTAPVLAEPPLPPTYPRLALHIVGVTPTAGPSAGGPYRSGSRGSHRRWLLLVEVPAFGL